MTTIILNEKATINAEGNHQNKSCKAVICLDDRKVYTSVLDAAKEYGVGSDGISRCCNGKIKYTKGLRFCFLKDVGAHLDAILSDYSAIAEKAAKYDAIMAEENAAKAAEEKYRADLEKAEEKHSRCKEIYEKAMARALKAEECFNQACAELSFVKETGVRLGVQIAD